MKSHSVILYRMLVAAVLLVAGGWDFEASAQAEVKNMILDAMRVSRSVSWRLDFNNKPCALLKVIVLADDVVFEGNIVGDVTRHGAAYWVYVEEGTRILRMSAPSFKEIEIRFDKWGIRNGVQGKLSYKIDVELPSASTPSKTKRGYVTFHLEPATANMFLDGQPLEVSDGTAFKLVPYGNYSYEVSKPGYATFSGTVSVNSEKIEVPVKLQSTKASVEVTAATPGCQIYVDGTAIGAAPIVRELMPGDYVLEARREGYRSREISVSLQASTSMPVNFPKLEMITGELSVEYQPLGSEVRLDGASVGTTPAFLPSVPVGSHKLDISHTGYQTANLTVNISETASTPITGTLTPVSQAAEEESWTTFEKNGKMGFKDTNGKIVIDAVYDFALPFNEGMAMVNKNGKCGFIDKNGKTIIPVVYEGARLYADSDSIRSFREGLGSFMINGKWGLIDKDGNIVILFEYDDAGIFSEGLVVMKKNDKWGYINKNGEIVIPFEYDEASDFSGGKAQVTKGSETFYINKKGERLSESASIPITGALTPVSQSGEEENWTSFEKNGKYGFKDANGKIVIDAIYDDAYSFSEGLALVRKGSKMHGKWGFIDKNGEIVIPIEYDFAYGFSDGLAIVEKGKKWGFIDKNGTIIIPFKYDGTFGFSEGLAPVRKGNKWGFIDKNDIITIPFEYDTAGIFIDCKAQVRKGSDTFFINKKGERLP